MLGMNSRCGGVVCKYRLWKKRCYMLQDFPSVKGRNVPAAASISWYPGVSSSVWEQIPDGGSLLLSFLRQLPYIVIILSGCALCFTLNTRTLQSPAKELSWKKSLSVINVNFPRDSSNLELEIYWLSHELKRISVHRWKFCLTQDA